MCAGIPKAPFKWIYIHFKIFVWLHEVNHVLYKLTLTDTTLLYLIVNDYADIIKWLCDNISTKLLNQSKLFQECIRFDNVKIAKIVFSYGSVKDIESVLKYAIELSSVNSLEWLLSIGYNIDASKEFILACDNNYRDLAE